jgi:sodium transport system permease protein
MSAWVVFKKELIDALRDRKTLFTVFLSSVAVGPVILLLLSALISGIEKRAEERKVMVAGIEHAATLRNYLERQTYTIEAAPADFEKKLTDKTLSEPVVVVGPEFERELQRGEQPLVELVNSSANQQSSTALRRIERLLRGFGQEQATLKLALRGVPPGTLMTVDVQERDLANQQTRSAQLTSMLPFFILMAVLYGALNAALDTTAGERERGSLEPLLMNPSERSSLVLGKWAAVASVGMFIAVLTCVSFLPAQYLLRSESLAALFQFGWREAALFIALLAPLAAALSAVLMAVAIRCKSFKEAQANNTVVILAISMLPLITIFNQGGEQPWHLWLPALGQITLMNRVLKGEALGAMDLTSPLLVSSVITVLCIVYIARHLRTAAVR